MAAVVQGLSGLAAPMPPSVIAAAAVQEAVSVLRCHATPGCERVASALADDLHGRGQYRRLMGLSVGRGKRNQVFANIARREAARRLIVELASRFEGSPRQRAVAVRQMLIERHPDALALHPSPQSAALCVDRIACVIREDERP